MGIACIVIDVNKTPTTDAAEDGVHVGQQLDEDVVVAQHPKYRNARLVYTTAGARLGMISTKGPGTYMAFRRQGEPEDHRKVADFTSIPTAAEWIARGNH